MQQLLNKKQLVNSFYEIQFFIDGNDLHQKYRVKSRNGGTYMLKLYNSSKLPPSNFINGNLLEIEILSLLNKHQVIRFVDNGEVVLENRKYHFIILDFIPGETLQNKLQREGTFSLYRALPLIKEVLEVVGKIHNHPKIIIHNNINPSSITLDYSDNREVPVLTDFCFARYISSKSNSVDISRLNPFYIAPELYNGIFTPQSDLFSVGALFYHLIMGLPPWYVEIPEFQYTSDKLKEKIHKKRSEPLNFGLPGLKGLDDEHIILTIKKALNVNVDERFRDANDFIQALQRKVVLTASEKKSSPEKKVVKKEGEGFSAIAGMQELKNKLNNDVIELLNDKEGAEKYGISIPNGMLLFGPPRCGKTFFAERFAEEAGFNYKFIRSSDLASIYIHGSQEKIGELFREARENAPMILCFDEIDALVPNREKVSNTSQAGEVNEFLTQLNNCGEQGIFVIGTTNYPQGIDPAVLGAGRMDIKIFVPVPDFEARKALFELYLKKRPVDLGIDFSKLSELTENYVAGDIVLIIQEASRLLRKSRERITQKILESIIADTRPSVSIEELKKFDLIKSKFENEKIVEKTQQRRPIGFRKPDND